LLYCFVSINDLVKEEAQRHIDLAIEEIPSDRSRLSTPITRSRFQYKDISDFLLALNTDILQEYAHGITETKSNNPEEESQKKKRDR
jgi:hypothetical protein